MVRKPLFIWVALLMLICIFGCSNNDELIQSTLDKAEKFQMDDNVDSALVYLEKALAAGPKHVEANARYQDLMRYSMNKEDEIYDTYKRKADEHPRDAVYQYLFARLESTPDLNEARKIVSMAPRKSWAYYHLGYAYYREGYDDEAIAAFDRVIAMEPENRSAYTYKAIVHQNTGEIDKAIETYRKLMEIDPDYVYGDISIWRLQYTNADEDKKEEVKKRILAEIDTKTEEMENVSFLSSLRYLYNTLGEPERAKQAETRLLALDTDGQYAQSMEYSKIYQLPTDADKIKAAEAFLKKYDKGVYRSIVYGLLFRTASNMKGYGKSELEKIEKAWLAEDDRRIGSAYYSLANHYMYKARDYSKTIDLCLEGLEKSRRVYRRYLYDMLGYSYVKTGKPEKGLEALMMADSLYGDVNPSVHRHMGEAYLTLGKTDKGMECLVSSLGLLENEEARQAYYTAYQEKHGTAEGAEAALNKAILASAAVDEPYPAPDFTLASLTDEAITLSDHIGKVMVVQFWKPG